MNPKIVIKMLAAIPGLARLFALDALIKAHSSVSALDDFPGITVKVFGLYVGIGAIDADSARGTRANLEAGRIAFRLDGDGGRVRLVGYAGLSDWLDISVDDSARLHIQIETGAAMGS